MEVGFAYPWVTPPYEFYRTDFPNYEGMDLLYKFNTGNISHLLQVFTAVLMTRLSRAKAWED